MISSYYDLTVVDLFLKEPMTLELYLHEVYINLIFKILLIK